MNVKHTTGPQNDAQAIVAKDVAAATTEVGSPSTLFERIRSDASYSQRRKQLNATSNIGTQNDVIAKLQLDFDVSAELMPELRQLLKADGWVFSNATSSADWVGYRPNLLEDKELAEAFGPELKALFR